MTTTTAEMNEEAAKFVEKLPTPKDNLPTAIVVVGMAGAGKTTFISSLYIYLATVLKKRVYAINLDPAVNSVPFPAHIDIRDTVNYSNIMKQFGLGPNGAILTALNLYATRFDQVLDLIQKRSPTLDYVLIDTPGQIEVFNWSASGTIILDSLALTLPTQIAYLIDAVRCQRATTLMSTLLYGCSVMYRTKLPFMAIFTKTDLADPTKQLECIDDVGKFADAADEEQTYAASLSKSCALALAPFYESFPRITVAIRGDTRNVEGFDKVVETSQALLADYFELYLPWVISERERMAKERKEAALVEHETFASEYAKDHPAEDEDSDREE